MEKNTQNAKDGQGDDVALAKVKEIIGKQLSKKPEIIKITDRIVEDLGADSLDIVEMLMTLEEDFGIQISDDDAMNIKTVGDLVNYLNENNA